MYYFDYENVKPLNKAIPCLVMIPIAMISLTLTNDGNTKLR
jgi:hypothetical protein